MSTVAQLAAKLNDRMWAAMEAFVELRRAMRAAGIEAESFDSALEAMVDKEAGKATRSATWPTGSGALDKRKEKAKRFEYRGQQLTINELAALAGCDYIAMYYRLTRTMHSAEEAVAMGAKAPLGRPRKPEAAKPAAPKPAKPARAPKVAAPQPAPTAAPAVTIKAQETVLAKDAEPIVPAGLKPQVAATPPGRFEVADAPAVFSALRPGQYSDQGSAWARAVTERKA